MDMVTACTGAGNMLCSRVVVGLKAMQVSPYQLFAAVKIFIIINSSSRIAIHNPMKDMYCRKKQTS